MASTIEKLLQCPICFQRMTEPKSLPCQHTFCKSCLESVKERGRVKCTECQKFYGIPYGDVENLVSNLTIKTLLEASNTSVGNGRPLQPTKFASAPALIALCQACNKDKIFAECHHCLKIVCGKCQIEHTKDIGRTLQMKASRLATKVEEMEKWNRKEGKWMVEYQGEVQKSVHDAENAISRWSERAKMEINKKAEEIRREIRRGQEEIDQQVKDFKEKSDFTKRTLAIAKLKVEDISKLHRADASVQTKQKEAFDLVRDCDKAISYQWIASSKDGKALKKFIAFRQYEADEAFERISNINGVCETNEMPTYGR